MSLPPTPQSRPVSAGPSGHVRVRETIKLACRCRPRTRVIHSAGVHRPPRLVRGVRFLDHGPAQQRCPSCRSCGHSDDRLHGCGVPTSIAPRWLRSLRGQCGGGTPHGWLHQRLTLGLRVKADSGVLRRPCRDRDGISIWASAGSATSRRRRNLKPEAVLRPWWITAYADVSVNDDHEHRLLHS
jgi:hypothetical protein